MDRTLLSIIVPVFFCGGIFGFLMGMAVFLDGGSPAEYGVLGIGGGLWLLGATFSIYVRNQIGSD